MASRFSGITDNPFTAGALAGHDQGCPCGDCRMDDLGEGKAQAAAAGRLRLEDSMLVNLPDLARIAEPLDLERKQQEASLPDLPVETPFVDTIPDNVSTTATIAIGGSVSSRLDTVGDRDWFRVELVAGQTYVFETSATGTDDVEDAYLRLHNSAGTQLAENDDGGAGLFSRIVFTATTSGSYYVNVGSYLDEEDGNYRVSAGIQVPLPVFTNDQIAAYLESGFWNGVPRHFNVAPGGTLTVNITQLNAAGQNLAREALALWTDATGIAFAEIGGTAQLRFIDEPADDAQGDANSAFATSVRVGNIIQSSLVNVGTGWVTTYGSGLNTYSFQTYIHEIGHALGLGHAGDYNGSADYGTDNQYQNDSWATSIMSYFDQQENTYFSSQGFTRQFAVSPIVADILATTIAYGTPSTTRTGATTYGFNNNSGRAIFDAAQFPSVTYTVVDHGGIDTLDYSLFTQTQRIDLNAEAFSNVGGRVGNVTIARGTLIENAVGGSGNDTIVGNAANNVIFLQRGGNDIASGGEGSDGFYFGGAYTSVDNVDGGNGTDQLGLQGNYAGGIILGNLTGVEQVVLLAGDDTRFGGQTGTSLSYNITTTEANVAAGQVLTFQANTLRAGENFTLNASSETNGSILTFGGSGTETITGGAQADGFYFGTGKFNPGDTLNGGGGSDQIGFQGNFSSSSGNEIVFGAAQLTSIEFVVLLSANDTRFGGGNVGQSFNYTVRMDDGNVAAGQSMVISANTLRATEQLDFNGALEMDGSFRIFSGAGNDFITGSRNGDEIFGGAGNDRIYGHNGADALTGGAGNDTFDYNSLADSTNAARDGIRDFTTGDVIDLRDIGTGVYAFIGAGPRTGSGQQLQVVQAGNSATVFVYVDADATADVVIDVTVADAHTLTASDFATQSPPQEPLDAPKADLDWAWDAGYDPYVDPGMAMTRDLHVV